MPKYEEYGEYNEKTGLFERPLTKKEKEKYAQERGEANSILNSPFKTAQRAAQEQGKDPEQSPVKENKPGIQKNPLLDSRSDIEAKNRSKVQRKTAKDSLLSYYGNPLSDFPNLAEGRDVSNEIIEEEGKPVESKTGIRDVAQFLVGDELGAIGFSLDKEAELWSVENFKEQWSEHPIMSTIATLGTVLPIVGALRKASLVGRVAAKSRWSLLKEATHVDELKAIARDPDLVDEFFRPEQARKILAATTEKEVDKVMPRKTFNAILLAKHSESKWMKLKEDIQALHKSGKPVPFLMRETYRAKKAWSNQYFRTITGNKKIQLSTMDQLLARLAVNKLVTNVPKSSKHARDMYKYMNGWMDEAELLARNVPKDQIEWVTDYRTAARSLWDTQVAEGFADVTSDYGQAVVNHMGGAHIPALNISTPAAHQVGFLTRMFGGKKTRQVGKSGVMVGVVKEKKNVYDAFNNAQMKARKERLTRETIEPIMDKLITDPEDLLQVGYINDRVQFEAHRFLRDFFIKASDPNDTISHGIKTRAMYDAHVKTAPSLKKFWIDPKKLPEGVHDRVMRMINLTPQYKDNPIKELPFIHTDVFDDLFGEFGAAKQSENMISMFKVYTSVHKTAMTALNPASHGMNSAGNLLVFLPLRGFNPGTPEALNDAKKFSHFFHAAAKVHHKQGIDLNVIMTKKSKGGMLEDFFPTPADRIMKGKNGIDIDIVDLLDEPAIKDIMEAQAFDAVEGFSAVAKMFEKLSENPDAGTLSARALAKAVNSISNAPGIKGVLNGGSSAYLAEDMIPKFMYIAKLAKDGWSTPAIIREIGRSLPQYGSVGKTVGDWRKLPFPWLTFAAEATRIFKNNMSDYPLRTFGALQATGGIQAAYSMLGYGPNFEASQEVTNQIKPWAARPTSVYVEENAHARSTGVGAGAFLGGVAGGAIGGAKGAAIGAVAGGATGGILGDMAVVDEDSTALRSWALDFLPYSSLFPTSKSPYALSNISSPQELVELSPQTPYSILLPAINALYGKGVHGQDIPAPEGVAQKVSKTVLNTVGLMFPPWFQKYLMKVEGPTGAYIPLSDAFTENGELEQIPKWATATFSGLALAGAALAGSKRLNPGKAFGAAEAILGGTTFGVGAVAGRELSTRRLMEDFGVMTNPNASGSTGNPVFDVAFNSVIGINKSWPIKGEYEIMNIARKKRSFQQKRSEMNAQYKDAVDNGQLKDADRILESIMRSFYLQNDNDIQRAEEEFLTWKKRNATNLMKHGQSLNLSEKDFIRILEEKSRQRIETGIKEVESTMAAAVSELAARRMIKLEGMKVNLDYFGSKPKKKKSSSSLFKSKSLF